MNADFQIKHLQMLAPISVGDNSAASTVIIDTYGYETMRVAVDFGVMSSPVSLMNLAASDLSNMASSSNYANFGTDTNDTGSTSTLPLANNSNSSWSFEIDLRGKPRYWQLGLTMGHVVNTGAGAIVSATADLGRPHEAPRTASQANYKQRIIQ